MTNRIGAALGILLAYLLATAWLIDCVYLSVFETGALLLTALLILRIVWREGPIGAPWVLWLALLFPLAGMAQLATGATVYRWKTELAILEWASMAGVMWLSAYSFAEEPARTWFRKAVAAAGLTVAVFSLLHWYTSPGLLLWHWPNPYAWRTPFPLLNHSHLAAFEQLAIAPIVLDALERKGIAAVSGIAVALMTGAVFATGARAGGALILAELLVLILLRLLPAATRAVRVRRAAALLAPSLVLGAILGWQGLAARLAAPPRDDLRPMLAASTLEMIKTHPLTGFGLGAWDTVYPAYARFDLGLFVEHAHNDWLEWAAEGGVFFACALFALPLFAASKIAKDAWGLAVLTVFLQAATDFPLHKPAVSAIQFAVLGYLAVPKRAKPH